MVRQPLMTNHFISRRHSRLAHGPLSPPPVDPIVDKIVARYFHLVFTAAAIYWMERIQGNGPGPELQRLAVCSTTVFFPSNVD